MKLGFTIFEVKFEIEKDSEFLWVERLKLKFDKEYTATDYYLESPDDKTLKLKLLDGRIIFYEIICEDGIFEITGKNISDEEKGKILVNHPIRSEINRKKRVYLLKEFNVKVDFDYMKQLQNHLFLEIHSNNKDDITRAKDHLEKQGVNKIITVSYDKV